MTYDPKAFYPPYRFGPWRTLHRWSWRRLRGCTHFRADRVFGGYEYANEQGIAAEFLRSNFDTSKV
jgi:hypothetical protein